MRAPTGPPRHVRERAPRRRTPGGAPRRAALRSLLALHALVLIVGVSGCDQVRDRLRGRDGGVSDSTFVATMAELRLVQTNASLDSAGRAVARQRILQRRGLTPASLERAARALAADPQHAGAVWQAINNRVARAERGEVR
jgi:hypothetical protein